MTKLIIGYLRGAPNTSWVTLGFLQQLKAELFFYRWGTDNGITERFYALLKHEKIAVLGNDSAERSARDETGGYYRALQPASHPSGFA